MSSSITELLNRSAEGQSAALNELYGRLYPEIKRLAHVRLAQAGGVHGLDTTALVHEGFLLLADQHGLHGRSRSQFFAHIGQLLRSVVLEHLRAQQPPPPGDETVIVTLSAADGPAVETDLLALDAALQRMQQIDLALYELVEMHGFAGLTVPEIAAVHGVPTRTVQRDLVKARLLLQELIGDDHRR